MLQPFDGEKIIFGELNDYFDLCDDSNNKLYMKIITFPMKSSLFLALAQKYWCCT